MHVFKHEVVVVGLYDSLENLMDDEGVAERDAAIQGVFAADCIGAGESRLLVHIFAVVAVLDVGLHGAAATDCEASLLTVDGPADPIPLIDGWGGRAGALAARLDSSAGRHLCCLF